MIKAQRTAAFIASRLVSVVLTIAGATLLLFLMMRLVPGDFASVMLGPRATPELRVQITQAMGLDRSIPEQLWLFFSRIATGDFGVDVVSNRPILDIVMDVIPNTLALAFSALALALLVGIPIGVIAALKPGSWLDSGLALLSISFITTPTLVVSVALFLVFAIGLHWLPVAGAGEPGDTIDQLRHLILPSVALALGWIGYISRLVRASLLDTLAELHVRTLRAYGVSEYRIVGLYSLKLALVPIVSILGIGLGELIGSSVVVEIIFARPGIGSLIFNSIAQRNYPIVQACVVFIVTFYIIANLMVDMINALLDPRIAAGRG
ncbi:peptide/nickel transport system permease protein [Aminobacter niigataensis]|uniref:Peptide/nickel transport system permease protein n=1 Tax=Aminobacter niigataensis TaxID=83265 RepID=A0ABR6L4M1_9HYPH|nr:ABC transporter permease [Aminobacter niigataensis]MBB4651119.1 peptide/nickel transport system permease protein [Aminobacter niigataensis]